jgi:DNA repair exonuclease SbcCD nuclease subunit
VHYRFDEAKEMAAFFGEETDLFVLNGDIGEVETEENFLEVCAFTGEISQGKIPMIFARGNHDTRGRLSALYPKYFPVESKNTYYTFEIGCLNGIVLDCGEDKMDARAEYDSSEDTPIKYLGINRFHAYRQRELQFLKEVKLGTQNKIPFAISHLCPAKTTNEPGGIFDIERETYSAWNKELERIGIKFMLSGHFHKAFILSQGDERNLIDHTYPVVVGSAHSEEGLLGAAITLNKDEMTVCFTNSEHEVVEKQVLFLADKNNQ